MIPPKPIDNWKAENCIVHHVCSNLTILQVRLVLASESESENITIFEPILHPCGYLRGLDDRRAINPATYGTGAIKLLPIPIL